MSEKLVNFIVAISFIFMHISKTVSGQTEDALLKSVKSKSLRYSLNGQKRHDNIYYQKWKSDTVKRKTATEFHRSERFLTSDWLLMMKGVAGASGPDLYQLWQSNSTLNIHLPLASRLTSEFNGHYKPEYSNHWSDYCIDQVKVSIYNHGVEKAYIVFDARGADKLNWFTDHRILRSSWADLQISKKESVSMAGNTQTGQEFAIVGHTASASLCDSFGWIMVSTKTTCFFEMGDSKPTFYYAPGTTQAHWGFVNPGSGDVFAIHAHQTCTKTTTTVPPPTPATSYCTFRGHNYHQGESWKDGCSQKCTCANAVSGMYICSDLCLTWHGSPKCHLLPAPPGYCCEQVFCSSGNISIPVAFKDEYPKTANSQYSYV